MEDAIHGHWKRPSTPFGLHPDQKKKHYESGYPNISFVDSPFRPMLYILARMIFQLIPVAHPQHFAFHLTEHGDLKLYNQDLAGFFTSIDQTRFIGAWHMLLEFLRPHMDVSDNEVFSIYPGRSNNPGDLIKGQTVRRFNVTELRATALNMQTFRLKQRCIRQLRGSPMGSPLSPALCLMVVSISEQIWSINFNEILTNHNLQPLHPPHPVCGQPLDFWPSSPL